MLSLVLAWLIFSASARPFDVIEEAGTLRRSVGFPSKLILGGVKSGGPSPGAGHSFTSMDTLGGMKNPGPSPGAGHAATTNIHQ